MQIAGSVIASAKMEIDPQSLDSPDLPICWVSEDQGSNHGRSYECTFCKRGFSNAQALGGHMNIHRRDRAKLKNPSTNTPFPTKNYPSLSTNYLSDLESSEMDHKLKWPWILPPDDSADDGELRQLPLFVDMPAMENSCEDRQVSPMEGNYGDLALQVGTQLGEGKSKRGRDLELDLELRLGPEPHDGTVMPLVLK